MRHLDDILFFIAVADRGSFTAAARDLRMSTSVVSRRVAALEDSLGVQLLHRSTRRLSMSRAGEELFARCRASIDEIERAREAVTRYSDEIGGDLRILSTLGLGQRLIAEAIGEFSTDYPQIAVELEVNPQFRGSVPDRVDVVLTQRRLRNTSKLQARRLADVRYLICAAPAYLDRHGYPESAADLAGHNCLVHTAEKPALEWRFDEDGQMSKIRVRGTISSNSGIVLYQYAVAGHGIARLPDYAVGEDIRKGRLVPIFDNVAGLHRALIALSPSDRQKTRLIATFLDFIGRFVTEEIDRVKENLDRD